MCIIVYLHLLAGIKELTVHSNVVNCIMYNLEGEVFACNMSLIGLLIWLFNLCFVASSIRHTKIVFSCGPGVNISHSPGSTLFNIESCREDYSNYSPRVNIGHTLGCHLIVYSCEKTPMLF